MWVILEMGNLQVTSFKKSWSSMTWMMHRGTPMTSDNHDFSLFSIVTTDFPTSTSQFSQVFVQQKPKFSAVFPCFFGVLSPLEGHRAAFPRLFWLNNCEATWWNDNGSLDHGGTFAYLAYLTLNFPRWELANAKLAGYSGVSTAIWMIWGWVKTLVPSEPQNSW